MDQYPWDFLSVSSVFYPDLGGYYEQQLYEWYRPELELQLGDVEGNEPDAQTCASLIARAHADPDSIVDRDELFNVAYAFFQADDLPASV